MIAFIRQKFRPQDLTLKMQKEWSDRLPASTTKEYVQVCTILNNRKYFDENTYKIISEILKPLWKTMLTKHGLPMQA